MPRAGIVGIRVVVDRRILRLRYGLWRLGRWGVRLRGAAGCFGLLLRRSPVVWQLSFYGGGR